MPDDNHVLDLLPAYALGGLDKDEAIRVEKHLVSCYVCRAELRSFRGVADQLALAAPEAAPPPELKPQLMRQVGDLRSDALAARVAAARQRIRSTWSLASLLLILLLAVVNLQLWQRVNRPGTATGPRGMRAIALQATDAESEASGFIVIGADGQNGALVVDEMPVLDSEQEYQLWLIRDGQSTSGAVFSVDEDGYRGVRISAPGSLVEYSAVSLTIEPAGGSPHPTGGQVLGGSLRIP